MDLQLKDKVTLITGPAKGMGAAITLAFAREGADVLIAYLDQDDDAADTVRLVEDAGCRAVAVAGGKGHDRGEIAAGTVAPDEKPRCIEPETSRICGNPSRGRGRVLDRGRKLVFGRQPVVDRDHWHVQPTWLWYRERHDKLTTSIQPAWKVIKSLKLN